jgi:cell division cycle 2-like protein
MSVPSKSRWANEDPEEEAAIAQRKREKEEKKRAKAEKQRKLEEPQKTNSTPPQLGGNVTSNQGEAERPSKRRRLSNESQTPAAEVETKRTLLRFPTAEWAPCRHVDNYERLNHIEEGSYGLVSRAKDIVTGQVVALKKLKIDNSPDGFPVTGLREIQTLQQARHHNIVHLREIAMGNSMDE